MDAAGWGRDGEEPFLASLPPGPHRLPRELVRDHQRRRILAAALEVFAERGLAATTVKDLIGRAHVSRATFYEAFPDKEACMVALHDEVLDWLGKEVTEAIAGVSDWAAKVRTAVARAIEVLGADPRLARLCAVEAPSSRILRVEGRHARMVDEICAGLRIGRAESPRGEELPEILEPAMVCGAIYLVGRSLAQREGPDEATLAPELAELMLMPYSS